MYLTPSLYVKNKGSTRSETTQPNWNGGFSCRKEPAVELPLPGSSTSHPSLAAAATTKRTTRSPARSKAIWAKNGYSRGGGWKYGEVTVQKIAVPPKKRLEPNIRRKHMRSWNQKLCFMFLLHVHRICIYNCIFTRQCIYQNIKPHLYISSKSYSSPFCQWVYE